ncbi:MAG: hypothetical protein EZS28_051500, partial [Streblomastix strix]
MATIYDKLNILNIRLLLHKRIRILGGVQGLYSFPQTLVVLNGCGAFVFNLGPRLDDSEVEIVSRLYKISQKSKEIANQAMYSETGKYISTAPFHAQIVNVRNLTDSKGQPKLWSMLSLPKKRQFYAYDSETSAHPTGPLESYSIYSPFTFNIRQIALIIAPSPITSFIFIQTTQSPQSAPLPTSVLSADILNEQSNFKTLSITHKMANIIPQYILLPQY